MPGRDLDQPGQPRRLLRHSERRDRRRLPEQARRRPDRGHQARCPDGGRLRRGALPRWAGSADGTLADSHRVTDSRRASPTVTASPTSASPTVSAVPDGHRALRRQRTASHANCKPDRAARHRRSGQPQGHRDHRQHDHLAAGTGHAGASYDVLRAGVRIATVSGLTFTDIGLQTGTSYLYSIQANGATTPELTAIPGVATTATVPAPSTGTPVGSAVTGSTSDTITMTGRARRLRATTSSDPVSGSPPSAGLTFTDTGLQSEDSHTSTQYAEMVPPQHYHCHHRLMTALEPAALSRRLTRAASAAVSTGGGSGPGAEHPLPAPAVRRRAGPRLGSMSRKVGSGSRTA